MQDHLAGAPCSRYFKAICQKISLIEISETPLGKVIATASKPLGPAQKCKGGQLIGELTETLRSGPRIHSTDQGLHDFKGEGIMGA